MATAAYTTVVDRAIGDPLTEAIWDDQIKDNGNMLQGKGSGNRLVNGGFEVWQRGTGSFTSAGVYTTDRWVMNFGGGATSTITQETSIVDTNSRYALKAVTTGTNPTLSQKVEDAYNLRGKTVAVSVRVRQSVASGATVQITDDTGTTSTSSTSATTGSYVTLTTTLTVAATATYLTVYVNFTLAGTYYVDNAMLVVGPNAAPYEPLTPHDDLQRCQRYYETLGTAASGTVIWTMNSTGVGATWYWMIPYSVTKAVAAPTVTMVGTWTKSNVSAATIDANTTSECRMNITANVAAGGQLLVSNGGAGAYLTIEANP